MGIDNHNDYYDPKLKKCKSRETYKILKLPT